MEGAVFMPRLARVKTPQSIFHIFCRSISEVDLYKDDDDKRFYMGLFKKYQNIYHFKVYGYCLMSNHNHFIIDANGADISKIMHDINFSYAIYFNRRHKRHGHLFQDRFKSRLVLTDQYMYALSAYVHNNVLDLAGYATSPESYEFSSLGVYLGLRRDPFGLVNIGFVLRMLGGNIGQARKMYMGLVYECNDVKLRSEFEFENEGTEYRSGREILVRNVDPYKVVEFIISRFNVSEIDIRMKYARGILDAKALIIVLMRSLCGFKCTDICSVLGNITESRVSSLSSRGVRLMVEEDKYRDIVREFLESYAA
jgi:putative transposase